MIRLPRNSSKGISAEAPGTAATTGVAICAEAIQGYSAELAISPAIPAASRVWRFMLFAFMYVSLRSDELS
jgi:hypothetical protein